MASTLVVPLLVLVEHVNIHQLLGVSQHAAWGPEQRPMKKAKIRSLAGYSPWGHKESDMTEQITLSLIGNLSQVASIRRDF